MKAAKPYRAALYMRLSRDDDGVGESASIGTQRKMLNAYAIEHGFAVYGEYVDDGWSGTNFERPDWKRMIADIEDKKVNLVITKDLSRLGRDYITAGQYTEIYFPSKGVRYIAINDGYDSDSPYTDIAPFKNVINEMYARDTSKKIRSAFQTKMREGAYIGNFAPYGYKKDPENKNRLLIDDVVAPVVKEIFQMAEAGHSPSSIAKTLNDRGIMTPAVYRCSGRAYLDIDNYSKRKEWTSATICKLLRNIVYLGHIAQGKTTKVSFKSNITLRNPQEEWVIAFGMHEPIISQDTYDNVRKRSISRRIAQKTDFSNVFSGIAKCADCGHNMSTTGSRKRGSRYNLVCGGYKLYGSKECQNHFIDYDILYEVVLQELRELLGLSDEDRRIILDNLKKNAKSKSLSMDDEAVKEIEKREVELDRIIKRLYEDNMSGRLDDTRFYKLLSEYEAEQKENATRLSALKRSQSPETDEQAAYKNFFLLLDEITCVNELTRELVGKVIDKIEVFQGTFENGKRSGRKHQTIRIYYKFIGELDRSIVA